LKEVCKNVKTVCIIGSGLLGSELASSIANIGRFSVYTEITLTYYFRIKSRTII
jgi:hypothetical protein